MPDSLTTETAGTRMGKRQAFNAPPYPINLLNETGHFHRILQINSHAIIGSYYQPIRDNLPIIDWSRNHLSSLYQIIYQTV